MTKAGEEQLYDHQQEAWEKIFSANKSTPRTYEQDESSKSEQEYKPERKKPTRMKQTNPNPRTRLRTGINKGRQAISKYNSPTENGGGISSQNDKQCQEKQTPKFSHIVT